jgi:ribonucleotide reductase beta subunit family protein with ferritin-like domain
MHRAETLNVNHMNNFSLESPYFFSTFALTATLEDQQRLKKVSNSVFTTKIYWGALSRIPSVF